MKFIDLGCGLDSPVSPMMPGEDAPKKTYPCFSFTCDEPIDLPDGEFTFIAKGRKVTDEENTRNEDDPRYRYEIEVHGFKPGDSTGEPDAGTNLDPNADPVAALEDAMKDPEDAADGGDDEDAEGE